MLPGFPAPLPAANVDIIGKLFKTSLYTGNGSGQVITTGIDNASGSLIWLKLRDYVSTPHFLVDTVRGKDKFFTLPETDAETTGNTNTVTDISSTGFSVGNNGNVNTSGFHPVAWSFLKAPRFFDIVTYNGDGAGNRVLSHNLGVKPGLFIWRVRNLASNTLVYHQAQGAGKVASLIASDAFGASSHWPVEPTSSVLTMASALNGSGYQGIVYAFADDTSADGVIRCGSYTGNGSAAGPTVALGWEPQWLMVKRADGVGDWQIHDAARSPSNPRQLILRPSTRDSEASGFSVDFTSAGFQIKNDAPQYNASGGTYVYVAIRKAAP